MKKFIKKLLKEILLPESYHLTYFGNILDILESNSINLSSSLGTKSDQYGDKFFFLSFSRSKSLRLGYKAGQKNIAVIVFDGNKLNNNFKSLPVDYWGSKGVTKRNEWWASRYEYEERLISDKPTIDNVSKYIIRIDILFDISGDFVNNGRFINELQEIISLGKSRNIPINIYSSDKDLILKRNKINDTIVNFTVGDIEKKSLGFRERYENILTLLLFNYKYIDDYDLFKRNLVKFLLEHGLSEDDVNLYSIHEKMRFLRYNDIDFISSLEADLTGYFKSGKGGKFRELAGILANKIKKSKASSIREYIDLVISGKRPKKDIVNKNISYRLYELSYNLDTGEYDKWGLIDKNTKLSELKNIYFNSFRYNGYLDNNDFDVYSHYRNKDRTIGDFIDYLIGKYTKKKTKEIIHNSSYDSYYKKHFFELVI